MTRSRFLDVHLSIRFGRDEPEPEQHDTVTDATRHLDPEDA